MQPALLCTALKNQSVLLLFHISAAWWPCNLMRAPACIFQELLADYSENFSRHLVHPAVQFHIQCSKTELQKCVIAFAKRLRGNFQNRSSQSFRKRNVFENRSRSLHVLRPCVADACTSNVGIYLSMQSMEEFLKYLPGERAWLFSILPRCRNKHSILT